MSVSGLRRLCERCTEEEILGPTGTRTPTRVIEPVGSRCTD
jgi:hypothetical protein